MSIAGTQRFTRHRPCPVCLGYDDMARGRGQRCYGFLSDDGTYCHCTREEHAGPLPQHPVSLTYAHRLTGPCRCGIEHGQAIPGPVSAWRRIGRSSAPEGTLAATYVYTDASGAPRHRTLRYADPKSFRQQRYEAGEWRWGLAGMEPFLYRLPALVAAPVDVPVFLPEGEKDCDRLASVGLVATTNPMGAKSWRRHYGRWLRGRHIVLLEDNDGEGRARTTLVRRALSGVVSRFEVVSFPNLPEGGDVSDWLDRGGDVADLFGSALAVPA